MSLSVHDVELEDMVFIEVVKGELSFLKFSFLEFLEVEMVFWSTRRSGGLNFHQHKR